MIEIRSIRQTDFEQVLQCIHRSVKITNSPDYPEKIIHYQLTLQYTSTWLNNAVSNRYFIVALKDETIVGTGALQGNELKTIFVDPSFQKQGIGKEIVNHLEDHARSLGLDYLDLNSSITAVRFYGHLGFIQTEVENVLWLDEKLQSVHFVKSIEKS